MAKLHSLFVFCRLLERFIESRVLKGPNPKYYVTKYVWGRSFRVKDENWGSQPLELPSDYDYILSL